ncbi:MAG: HAMP domain-containing protein [Verrucomicrobia bacterium]|nr:HAMP domain-containing protein [Verrucomicrobiota bacterium]
MNIGSFRFKIALLSALISGLAVGGFGLATWYLLHRQKVGQVDTEIRSLGARHPGWLASRGSFERFQSSLEFIFGEEHQGQILLLLQDAQGQVLYVSPGWPEQIDPGQMDLSLADDPRTSGVAAPSPLAAYRGSPWRAGGGTGRGAMGRGPGPGGSGGPVVFTKTPRFFTAQAGSSAWRFGVMGNNEMRLAVGLNYDRVQAELNRMRNVILCALPMALLLVGGGGWLVAGRALRPLNTISEMAEGVTARGLDQRIPPLDGDPEIARLIRVLNGMMDRLEASFQQATRFSADASHELKTPLAVMQGELENAFQAAAPGSPEQQVFGNLLEETQRLKRITRGLLLLSQSDAGQLKLALEPVDLSAELEGMIEDARILAADSNLRFDVEIQPGMRIEADRCLLRMALLNLLSNAVKHNEANGFVAVSLAAGKGQAVLTVCNGGPGIPLEDQPRLFQRFYRADPTRGRTRDGLGLGLSLAREILQAHRGTLVLEGSRPGKTCFQAALGSLLPAGIAGGSST